MTPTTKQQVFEETVRFLLTQGKPSVNPRSGICVYRSGKLRCAAGLWIDDEHYDPEWDKDETNILHIFKSTGLPFDLAFWNGLQTELHDMPSTRYERNRTEFSEEVLKGARTFALTHGLTLPEEW